jgi:3-dehydroquinate dehydratase-2
VKVLVLNGPNLGRLGRRQPEIYGHTTYGELAHQCVEWGQALGLEVEVRQTNHEGEMLDWLNAAADDGNPVVLNAAAWTHYSYAILDACAQLTAPLVEVHISDPRRRPEEFRHTSVVTPFAVEVVAGHGVDGYRLALELRAGLCAGPVSPLFGAGFPVVRGGVARATQPRPDSLVISAQLNIGNRSGNAPVGPA